MMDSSTLPTFRGLIKFLFFTHNTLISVLYTMMTTPDAHHIRCCLPDGSLVNRGAQFRYGLDSQYGDIVFVMKRDFWLNMKGVDHHKDKVIDHPFVGHFYKHDFVSYNGDENKQLVSQWLDAEARMYDFRPRSGALKGKECKHSNWNVSWCNVQLHLGENVNFQHVAKVYAPAWIIHDTEAMAKIEANGVNTTLLRLIVTNRMPYYPSEASVSNPLNGLFALYGPRQAHQHYHKIEKDRGKFREKSFSDSIYSDIEPSEEELSIQTHRHASSSSTLSLHEKAFIDLQVRYMADLVRHNMTGINPKGEKEVKRFVWYGNG